MPNLADSFERIYVINLRRRTDRRRRMERELTRIGTSPSQPSVRFFEACEVDDAGTFRSRGERGCLMSHLEVAREALRDRLDSVLIFEDDAMFTPASLDDAGRSLLADLKSRPWHIAFLGHDERVLESDSPGPARWKRIDEPRTGMHCYALSGRDPVVLGELVDHIGQVLIRPPGHPDGGAVSTDPAYNLFYMRRPDVVTLAATPVLAVQGSSSSDLSPAWFDRMPPLRYCADQLRSIRLLLKRSA